MNKYVLGFLFDKNREQVLLIKKNRPEWQYGLLNGIGGKVEDNELPIDAMCREFSEETDYEIPTVWYNFGKLSGEGFEISLFSATTSNNLKEIGPKTDEKLQVCKVKNLPKNTITNLHWIIPMASKDNQIYNIQEC